MSHERQHTHRHTDTTQTVQGHDVAPGKLSRSAQLEAPTHPRSSGLLHRKARDSNGVEADAETAVAAASASIGAALPDVVMRKFEASLGADLSAVRVHAGGESASATSAVGARAYTTGQDIHFGAGQYAPSTREGEHLLAHEVVHTVQQRGGSPARQYKLEVSSPHDAAEHEADRVADAMVAGQVATIASAPVSAARMIQRDPVANASEKDEVTPAMRADALSAITLWRDKANQCVLGSCAWYSDNIGHFLSLTSSNPRLSWTDGPLFGALATVTGMAIKAGTSAFVTAGLGATIGSAAGPPGAIAGAIIATVAKMITSEILASIKGPSKVGADHAAGAGQAVNASAQRFFQQAAEGQQLVSAMSQTAQKNLDAATQGDVVQRIRAWAIAEHASANPPPKGDRSLFERMYSDWLLEHTSSNRLGPALTPGSGVDQAQWSNARRDAKPIDGKPIEDHLDLFAYQTRGFLARMGLSTTVADDMIAAARGATPENAGALMKRFDGKPLVFRTGDPGILLGFLGKYIDIEATMDAKAPKDVSDGNVTITVTPHLSILALGMADKPSGTITANNFTVHATLPDRQTHISKAPMDAGLPPVDYGTGKPKSYNVGTIAP
jgi:hypothetical protein